MIIGDTFNNTEQVVLESPKLFVKFHSLRIIFEIFSTSCSKFIEVSWK